MGLRILGHTFVLCQQWVAFCRGAFLVPVCGNKWTLGRAGQNVTPLGDHLITPFLSIALWLRPKLQHYPVLKMVCAMFRLMRKQSHSTGRRAHLKITKIKSKFSKQVLSNSNSRHFLIASAKIVYTLHSLFWKPWGVWLNLLLRVILVLKYLFYCFWQIIRGDKVENKVKEKSVKQGKKSIFSLEN